MDRGKRLQGTGMFRIPARQDHSGDSAWIEQDVTETMPTLNRTNDA
jgi:hypothetical protein